jgi:hypothetical protein
MQFYCDEQLWETNFCSVRERRGNCPSLWSFEWDSKSIAYSRTLNLGEIFKAYDHARLCGLLSAIPTSIAYSRTLNLGDIQSLRSGSLFIVFLVVDSIILVAISAVGDRRHRRDRDTCVLKASARVSVCANYIHND